MTSPSSTKPLGMAAALLNSEMFKFAMPVTKLGSKLAGLELGVTPPETTSESALGNGVLAGCNAWPTWGVAGELGEKSPTTTAKAPPPGIVVLSVLMLAFSGVVRICTTSHSRAVVFH